MRSEYHRQTHRSCREAVLAVRAHEQVFAQQLVAAVLVLLRAAVHRKILVNGQQLRGRVDHRRADEYVVPGAAAEVLEHEGDVLGPVGRHVLHDVVVLAAERGAQ
jgi:hypothetical protein